VNGVYSSPFFLKKKKKGAFLDAEDNFGSTPLHCAAENNCTAVGCS
jgi:hypothetical protein